MCGNNAAHWELGDGFQEETRPIELVHGIGALQYLIKNDERASGLILAELQQLLQAQQFGIEVRDAMRQVIGCAHTGE